MKKAIYIFLLFLALVIPEVSLATWSVATDDPTTVSWSSDIGNGCALIEIPGMSIYSASMGGCDDSQYNQSGINSAYNWDTSVLPVTTNGQNNGFVWSSISECSTDGTTNWSQFSTCESEPPPPPPPTATSTSLLSWTCTVIDASTTLCSVLASSTIGLYNGVPYHDWSLYMLIFLFLLTFIFFWPRIFAIFKKKT